MININANIPHKYSASDLENLVRLNRVCHLPEYQDHPNSILERSTFLINKELMDTIYPPEKRRSLNKDCLKDLLSLAEKRRREQVESELEAELEAGLEAMKKRGCRGRVDSELEAVKERTRMNERSEEPENDFWRSIYECWQENHRIIAEGVYVPDVTPYLKSVLKGHSHKFYPLLESTERIYEKLNLSKDPRMFFPRGASAIFICPERCINVGNNTSGLSGKKIFDIRFSKVFYHELAHYFIDHPKHNKKRSQGSKPYYGNPWSKIIEESMANAFSLTFISHLHQNFAREAMDRQPLEYTLYPYWEKDYSYIEIRKLVYQGVIKDYLKYLSFSAGDAIKVLNKKINQVLPEDEYWQLFTEEILLFCIK